MLFLELNKDKFELTRLLPGHFCFRMDFLNLFHYYFTIKAIALVPGAIQLGFCLIMNFGV